MAKEIPKPRATTPPDAQNPNVWSEETLAHIKHLIYEISGDRTVENADVVTEIIVTALKAVQAEIGRGDLKLLSRSIRELRFAFKIFKPFKDVRKVTIFGSARTKSSTTPYKMARDFARGMAKKGWMMITGAGPGIMQAGNEGAGTSNSFGVNIRLPFEQYPNKFIAAEPTYIDCRYFFTRKLVFVKEASAAVFFPGGFGTLDEAFEILTLVQTGKCDPMPVVFVEDPAKRFWRDLEVFLKKNLLKEKKISGEDIHLYRTVTKASDAVQEITHFYSNYHSIRYVGDLLVMRLQKFITDKQLAYLNKHFKDIVSNGIFIRSAALKEEENQPDIMHLPRLVFKFNRLNNGRLREVIDFLNKEDPALAHG